MAKKSMSRVVGLVLAACVVAGCVELVPSAPIYIKPRGPRTTDLAPPSPNAAEAIEAAGGLEAWKRTMKINLAGVVKMYTEDGSYYLTEQRYEVYPWSDSIRVWAAEPMGELVWELAGGRFEMLEGQKGADTSPLAGSYRDLAEAVLKVLTVPARFFDDFAAFGIQAGAAVQIEGRTYQPLDVVYATRKIKLLKGKREVTRRVEAYWTTATFYQDMQTRLVNMIWLAAPDQQRYLIVRGYDYEKMPDSGVRVPMTIEVFRSDAQAGIGDQLVKIDMKR